MLPKMCSRIVVVVIFCCHSAATLAAREVVLGFIGEPNSSAHRGVRQGLNEANAQGEFLGVSYRLLDVARADDLPANVTAVIAAVNGEHLVQIAADFHGIPVLNIAAPETYLREDCVDNLLHVLPSVAMRDDAERQWRRAHPGSQARARAWHKTFRKYAAAQLNIRFRDEFGEDMTDIAWSGWAAVKLLADTIVRQAERGSAGLLQVLKTNLAFDGQKGVDMSFRETGQLRQPLLLVDQDKIVSEAPVRGVVDTSDLDSLGIAHCPK